MFNNQPQPSGSVVAPVQSQPFGPGGPGTGVVRPGQANSQPTVPEKSKAPLILGILLVLVLIGAGVFAWLYFTLQAEYASIKGDLDGQIDVAVAMATSENTTKMENQFAEREKYPYRTFAGPADFGSLTFEYPKTWSVYIAADGSTVGSQVSVFMNPVEVYAQSLNALTLNIQTASFENVVAGYDGAVREGTLNLSVRNIGGAGGTSSTSANLYTGTLGDNLRGAVVVFRIRDKVVTIRVNAEIFLDEFYKLLDTITFVE